MGALVLRPELGAVGDLTAPTIRSVQKVVMRERKWFIL